MHLTYEDRAAGLLPHIDIAGTDFTIDWRLRELRETAAPWNSISLREAEMSPDGEAYYLLYDTLTHEEYVFSDQVTAVPSDVVFIQVPYEIRLDPYAVALQYGTDPQEFVAQFPFEPDLKATVLPLSATNIASLAEQNRLRLEGAARGR